MPHVIIKYFDTPLTESGKAALAEAITRALSDTLNCASRAVSIAMQPVAPADWQKQVFVPDIAERGSELIKIPDYTGLSTPTTE